ncbi:MAG: ECF-type sigma factor [Holophagales bacterium]|nr:ECF-type sigma factor [Holophagales bacterium]
MSRPRVTVRAGSGPCPRCFFVGLSLDETADVLGVSRATVVCHGRLARAWLFLYLRESGAVSARRRLEAGLGIALREGPVGARARCRRACSRCWRPWSYDPGIGRPAARYSRAVKGPGGITVVNRSMD